MEDEKRLDSFTLFTDQDNETSIEKIQPRILMTLNIHDKETLGEALKLHSELHGKAYIMGGALYVNYENVDLTNLFQTWSGITKKSTQS